MPERIQRRRTKGWRMPENTVYVGRGSMWGNPYVVIEARDGVGDKMAYLLIPEHHRRDAYFLTESTPAKTIALRASVNRYRDLSKLFDLAELRAELRGKNLACWCPLSSPCHADVLLELANEEGA